ncbi:asparagine synthase-related protein [Sphingomonas hengshuiensis]|uniref:asparagine synthase (glutamine-hydrolyzing) n=1 Tax=Sphingomonas hengshuiensis TaxID=1609977 RepID=A0A7U4LGD1_9SPHN|nr:asparagine synthetase B family protein [Sphingomonas hengshuiensis]AJP73400.1 hypothetical protein TS85_18795 [Sphingomonas hengshuiensis]
MNKAFYLAVVARPGPEAAERMHRLTEKLQAPGMADLVAVPELRVVGDPAAAQLTLPNGRGIILGHLFRRVDSKRVTAMSGEEALSSRDFVKAYWGGYVAIRAFEDRVEILRDPSGMVPCYHAEIDGVHVLTSRPDLLFGTGLLDPIIDWTIVAQSLVYRDFRPARTCLRGVSELLPGAVLDLSERGASTHCAWSPWQFAQPAARITDPAEAITTLRDVMIVTLGAWAGCFERPMIEISGGLDSSIVAAGMRAPGPAIHCLTFGPAAGDASELPWARAVAEHLGYPLAELVADAATVDIGHSDAQDLPRPCARAFSQALDRPIQKVAAKLCIDAFFGGGGGDSMFCLTHSALPLIDRLTAEGLGRGIFESAGDIAQLTRTNIWKVLAAAARRLPRAHSSMPRPMTNAFLARHVPETLPWPEGNSWLAAPPGVPPGKRNHVWSIIGIQNQLEGYGREAMAPLLAPLLSQPIAETCIAIPTWYWCIGGNNRAVAREAFRDRLPASVIDRRTKVSFSSLAYRVIRANMTILREMLLDGALARQGLLDRERIAGFLDGTMADGEALPELMALVEVEAWVRHWEARSLR